MQVSLSRKAEMAKNSKPSTAEVAKARSAATMASANKGKAKKSIAPATVIAIVVLALAVVSTSAFSLDDVKAFFFGPSPGVVQASTAKNPAAESKRPKPPHASGLEIADYSDMDLPSVTMGGRVADLVNGIHFDSILQDSPDDIRPAGVVVFYNSRDSECVKKYNALRWDNIAETKLPSRDMLFTARYDMYAAPRRAWYKFTPEMDLAKRFNVKQCPEVVFVPRSCNGWTDWCSRGMDPEAPSIELIGCENFVEQCTNTVKWDGTGDLASWIKDKVAAEGRPKLSKFLRTYREQGKWMHDREFTTSNTMMRNLYLSQAFPAFTPRGFKATDVPGEFMTWLLGFLERNKSHKRTEFWQAESTQMSFHETPTEFTDLDRERIHANRMVNKFIKPIVEEWSQMGDLELTAFYGVRHYKHDNWLRSHIDRIDSHVLSVTITVAKGEWPTNASWPLEVIDWNGDHVRYEHPAGTMVLYESSKLPHGRPYPNLGGDHLGAFVHFKPKSAGSDMTRRWDDIARVARAHQSAFTGHRTFRQTDPVEPPASTIEYASKSFGEGTKWTHLSSDGDEADEDEGAADANGGFSVVFKNEADRTLDLYWLNPNGPSVHQGTLARGTATTITTFRDHQFAFCEAGSTDPIPDGTFSMEMGRSVVKYSLTRDGTHRKPQTQFADKVREKLKQE